MKLQRVYGLFNPKRVIYRAKENRGPRGDKGNRGPRGLVGLPGPAGKKGSPETIHGNTVTITDYIYGTAMSTISGSRNGTVTFDKTLTNTPIIFTSPIYNANDYSIYFIYLNSFNYTDTTQTECTGFNFTIIYNDTENNENYTNYDQTMNLNFSYIAIQY
jgi:hypothetical protein